ncbi:extracellular solute-binding protein [Microbacterium horticulturae]|uniref:Extracellular solute-binding protein n=1 Tax=Microbacterium horticulturae TaxID=3028316 RepID=A0ABY8BXZ5_9MICO|nr:extracellular solute-binding protein [Microbacterium sp. KACC 23027]WEG09070.1 extracellular solute-binding protein [Microbacterium sp. KACC 23027]
MKSRALRRTVIVTAAVSTAALALAGCAGSSNGSGSGDSNEKITLTVTTFGTMGLDSLYKKYEDAHPNITIKATNIDTGGNALTDWQTKQAAGAGLPDVQSVEEGWLGQVMLVSNTFTDLRDYGADKIKDRWVPYKVDEATDKDGRIIGYGTDIGPEGLCYNRKLFEAAGLPTDRDAVAELFGGANATWEDYFKIGKQYHEKTGKAWYDQSGFVWNAMVNQLPEGYYKTDGTLNVKDNADLKARWALLSQGAADGLSSNQTQWDWGGGKAFVDGSFATFVCPGWMLGNVKNSTEAAGGDASSGWDFADVFPGGPANWGGTFLTVPTTSKHPKEAAALAEYLTSAPSLVTAFQAAGTFPSVIEAQTDPGVTGQSDLTKFFNDAPIGTILGKRAEGVKAQYKGPDDAVIQEQVFGPSIQLLDSGKADGTKAWNNAMKLLDDLVINK